VIYVSSGNTAVIDGFTITRGFGDFSGGGIYADNATLTIKGNRLSGNTAAGDGGGIFINYGTAHIIDNQISNNSATWAGGIRFINDAKGSITGNEIFSNTASNSGGGIYLECCGASTPLIAKNEIHENQSSSWGGGVLIASANARLENNFISNNLADKGDGLYMDGTATFPVSMTLIHNTLVGDDNGDKAIWAGPYISATVINNIFAFHSTGVTITMPASATFAATHNLFWNSSDPYTGTSAILDDPLLDDDHHLRYGSPAIDAGTTTSVTSDIDGDVRPIGSMPDIGADERDISLYLPYVLRKK